MIRSKSEKGVSAVIGVILMIGLAIVLSAVVSQFALQLPDVLKEPVNAGVSVTEDVNMNTNELSVTVTWTSKGTSSYLEVNVDGVSAELRRIGQSEVFTTVQPGTKVTIVGVLDNGRRGVVRIHQTSEN